MRESINSLTN